MPVAPPRPPAPAPVRPARAPQPAPAAPAPNPVNYGSAFEGALGAARSSIAQQFQLALSDVAKREAAAGQAVGALPGQLGTIYQQGQSSINNATGALDSAQAASGLRSFMPAQAQLAPLAAASANDQAARLADVPLLQLAMQTEMGRQRGALNQARLGAEGEIEQQRASYLADMARLQASQQAEAQQRAFDREAGRTSTAEERAYQDRVREDEQNFALRLRRLEGKTADVDQETSLSQQEVSRIRQSKRYKDAFASLRDTSKKSGGFGIGPFKIGEKTTGQKPATPEEIYKKYRSYPKVLKVLIKDMPELAAYVAGILGG